MKILILAEHDNQQLKPSLANILTAAKQISGNITVLVAGYQCESVAKAAAQLAGVDKVLLAEAPYYAQGLAEDMAWLIKNLCLNSENNGNIENAKNVEKIKNAENMGDANKSDNIEQQYQYDYVLAPASTYGKNILPRLAALVNVSQISEITQILSQDTFLRPTYAGNVLQTIQSFDPIKIITVRTSSFSKSEEQGRTQEQSKTLAPIEKIKPDNDLKLSTFVKQEQRDNTRPDLSSATIVISGGRGLQSKENFKLIEDIADKLGAAIGASRAAVDAGFVPNDYQVGQTGKVVAPELYIAVGISGAIQHIAGMKDSKVIVAINKDPDAAILQVCDYYLIGDLFEILPALKDELDDQPQLT